jgi:hypothetical protein
MRIWAALFVLLAVLEFQTGCGLRTVEATPMPKAQASLPAQVQGKTVSVALAFNAAKVKGGHHEGLLQVRQPWFMGLTSEQRHLLYDNAGQVAALGFAAGLKDQGLVVQPEQAAYLLGGTVRVVTMDTYGHGSKEGFGSAGNYWEAKVEFSELKLTEALTGRVLWEGSQEGYARLTPCPLHMDWGILKVLVQTMSTSLQLSTPKGLLNQVVSRDAFDGYEGSFKLEDVTATPIEVAARQAAVEMLGKVVWP